MHGPAQNDALSLPLQPIAPFRKPFVLNVVSDGLRVGLSTQYFDGASQMMRELGCSWFGLRRMWLIQVSAMRQVIDGLLAQSDRFPAWSFEDVREKAAYAWRNPQRDFFTELMDVQLVPLDSGGFACLAVYDPLFQGVMREMNGRYQKYAAAWEVRAPRQAILAKLQQDAGISQDFVFVHEQVMHMEKLIAPPKSEVPITVPGAAPSFGGGGSPEGDGDKIGSGFLTSFGSPIKHLPVDEDALTSMAKFAGLRHYQVDGVRFMLGLTGVLLADDMGVGKSRQGAVAARMAAGSSIVLVVCPASLCINWQREINAIFPDEKVAFISQHSMAECAQANWIIANYERLAGLVKATDLPLGVMLVDEAQNLKEFQAGRTRNAFILSERIERIFLLTGTPILNREAEMHTLLRLSGHRLGKLSLADFRKTYAGSAEKRALLADELRDWMLRRGKDVLSDLGQKIEQVRYVAPAGGLSTYNKILKDPHLQTMPKLTKLREHLEFLKIDFILESVQALPEQEKVLVFVEFTDTVDLLLKAFDSLGIEAVHVIGKHTPKQRMQAVDAIQTGTARVFIGTSKAAGVGLTLTRANYVFLMSLPWTNALKRQSEDRAYRSGNVRDVFVIIPLIAGTIDEQVMALLGSKEEIEDDVVEAVRIAVQ